MRLFIAICFEDNVKDALKNLSVSLSEMSLHGNFTRRENFHLTLHFIGETSRVSAIKQAMDCVNFTPFKLDADKCGKFRRDGGDIWWVGIGENPSLKRLYADLCKCLIKQGFKADTRDFKPHLTIGREVTVDDSFDNSKLDVRKVPEFSVNKICLMKSERINGKLTYTCIYEKYGEDF